MAIIQISKIQQRSGNLVDLPQLDEAQLGWANDAKRLFIGTTTPNPNENVEVLTAYSDITFSQINGSEGNLNISNAQNGQILTYVDSTSTWENYVGSNTTQLGGDKLQLGNIDCLSITGGVNGYVLQTDGLGNLSWTSQTGGGGSGVPGGANTQIQFNDGTGNFAGNAGFTFDYITGAVAIPGTLSVSNTITGTRLISNIATGTAPLVVTSTTQVANLNVATAGTAGTVTTAAQPNITSTGTLTSLSVTGNVSAGNVSATTFTGALSGAATTAGTVTTAAQPNITSVGTLTSLSVNGTITGVNVVANTGYVQTTSLTAGANSTAGTVTGNWTLTAGSQLNATYADLAEYYEADQAYEPGTVLAFGGDKEVTLADDGTTKVAGIVSTNPAYVMNSACKGEHTVALALQGRVPCKVRGNIKKGDMLISAGYGFARPSASPLLGTVIGKSLENFEGIEGVIEVAVGRL